MQFCSQCKFLTYTKLDKDTSKLINYCKNCLNEEPLTSSDNSVYKRNYQEDYIADKIVTNKYTIYDVALPRVEFDCINKNCYTNIDLNIENSFLVVNLPEDEIDENILGLFKYRQQEIKKQPIRIRLSSVLIQCDTKDQKEEFKNYYSNNREFKEKNYKVAEITSSPNKEVLYLKYDPINMKYLYMCVNCGTSWKKI